jgi:hypothetical protein
VADGTPDPKSAYQTNDPIEGTARKLKHELVAEAKRVVEAIALLDVSQTAPDEVIDAISKTRALADRLEDQPSVAEVGGLASAGPDDAALMERSGISGRSNPLAPPLYLHMDDDGVTRGNAFYTLPYEGPPGCLHGGFVAAAFDDLLGFAQMASGKAGLTGTLTVRMIRPTPLRERIDYEAWFDHAEGRKIWCRARSRCGDTPLAEAEILFIIPKSGPLAQ